jgi:hypothetical protein
MAVSIQSGDHVVELEYQPIEILFGAIASILGGCGLILALTGWTHF